MVSPMKVLIAFLDQPIYQNDVAFVGYLKNNRKLVGIHVPQDLVYWIRNPILVLPAGYVIVPMIHSNTESTKGHQLFIIVFLE